MIWRHHVLFACPAPLTDAANALATATQHQPGDAMTFGRVWYAVGDSGTRDVSVAYTSARDEFVAMLASPSLLPDPPPFGADPALCAQAVSALTRWEPGLVMPDLTSRFVYVIDSDPRDALVALELTAWSDNEVQP